MTENTFWQSLRKKLVPRVYALKLNLRFIKGVPDAWLSGSQEDLWIELKYLQKLPPIVDCTKLLTVLQQDWLESRHREGRNTAVLVGSPEGHKLYVGLEWKGPLTRGTFIQSSKSTSEIAEELIEILGEQPPTLVK